MGPCLLWFVLRMHCYIIYTSEIFKKICESVILARMMIFDNKRLISSRVYKGLFWRSIPAVSSQNYFVEYYHAGISQDFRI